jgi:hypothetical protein
MAGQPQSGYPGRGYQRAQIRPNENTSKRTAWRPLRLPIFRNLLIADLLSDIGTLMQGVGAAWLMVSQGTGPKPLRHEPPGRRSGSVPGQG